MIIYGKLDLQSAFRLNVLAISNPILNIFNGKQFDSKMVIDSNIVELYIIVPREIISPDIIDIISNAKPKYTEIKDFYYIEQFKTALMQYKLSFEESVDNIIVHPKQYIYKPIINIIGGTIQTKGNNSTLRCYQAIQKLLEYEIIKNDDKIYIFEVNNKIKTLELKALINFSSYNLTNNEISGETLYSFYSSPYIIQNQSKFIASFNVINYKEMQNAIYSTLLEHLLNNTFIIITDEDKKYAIDTEISFIKLNGENI